MKRRVRRPDRRLIDERESVSRISLVIVLVLGRIQRDSMGTKGSWNTNPESRGT